MNCDVCDEKMKYNWSFCPFCGHDLYNTENITGIASYDNGDFYK